ncbi:MAG: hypothetical protein NTX82_02565 [Candidatus Parcubacteria bacterium]|nr:hypothetical protein [Candidatus Parcubacteria bacterium]
MKFILTAILALTLLLTGCVNNFLTIKDDLTFKHGEFSIQLPALYVVKDNDSINPINEGSFPVISFFNRSVDSEPTSAAIQTMEAEYIGTLCSQTDSCPKIINYENISLDGRSGLKQTTKIQGRSLDVSEGYIMGYSYIVYYNGKLFYFSTGASDLENPDKINAEFDKIMQTVSFK